MINIFSVTMQTKASLAGLILLMFYSATFAYETDQFTDRNMDIGDSQNLLDRKVNLAIGESIIGITDSTNKLKVVSRIYHKLGGAWYVDKIEKFAMQSTQVERLATDSGNSIYSDIPIWATRVAGMSGVGATIKIDGVLMGTDKLGHFFSQGRKFYLRWLRMQNVEKAAEHSAYTERAIFGKLTTGSYSNADLVANFEGFRFYRSLFEPDPINEKPAILRWQGNRWIMQRPFEWSDYVNDYWDEALNINYYDRLLYPHIKAKLMEQCDWYHENSQMYQVHDEEALLQRYQYLQLEDTSELRFNNLCSADLSGGPSSMTARD